MMNRETASPARVSLRRWTFRRVAAMRVIPSCMIILLAGLGAAADEGLSTPDELEAFLDGVMAAQMQAHQIPAATVSVVKDGELFLAKGYGLADRERGQPVLADRTLFRPGSISKLFTWTAVMQLVERGELDLQTDVNEYLTTFRIPDTYPQPVTLEHLMTHTPGFEDGALGYLFVRSADDLVPLAESLAAHIPARVRLPGTYSAYSNWGSALAGLIVANVSGMPFEEYVERNIFEPLGMEHSTFREPLPQRLAPDMATAYEFRDGVYEEGEFEYIANFGPAGALSSTATDMARFMIAHLQDGRLGEARILKDETARRMHSQLYTLDPRLPGMAYGFYETRLNDQHIIGHGGDTRFFHSNLALLPEHGVGLFVSYVNAGGVARLELLKAFLDRYFPAAEPPAPEPPTDFAQRAERFTGTYRFTRHNYSTVEKVTALVSTISVGATPENTLLISGLMEHPLQFVEVEPLLFQQVDGWQTAAFEEGADGRMSHLFFGLLPFMPAYRVPWYETPGFTTVLLGLGGLLFVTWTVSALLRRKPPEAPARTARWAAQVGAAISVVNLLFVVSVVAIVASKGLELFYGLPVSARLALALPVVSAVLTLAALILLVPVWQGRAWSLRRRLHYTLFTLFAVGWIWFYAHWNLLGVTS